MQVIITQEHLDKAASSCDNMITRSFNCPISMGLADAFGKPCWVGIDCWGFVDSSEKFALTNEMKRFVQSFDEGINVKPTTFLV